MVDMHETLRCELTLPEYSEGYAESFLDAYIATQIKVLREQHELTQTQLAVMAGMHQTVISRLENVNYSRWNIGTLKRLARAFRVRLHVSFETYGSLIDLVERFDRESLKRVPREEDPGLQPRVAAGLPTSNEVIERQATSTFIRPRETQGLGIDAVSMNSSPSEAAQFPRAENRPQQLLEQAFHSESPGNVVPYENFEAVRRALTGEMQRRPKPTSDDPNRENLGATIGRNSR